MATVDLSVGVERHSVGPAEGPTTGRVLCVCQFLVCLGSVAFAAFRLHFVCVLAVPSFLLPGGVSSVYPGDQSCVVRFFVGRVVSVGESGVLGTTLSLPAQKGIRSSRLDQQRKREVAKCWLIGFMGGWNTWRIGSVGWSNWRKNTYGRCCNVSEDM